MTPGEQRLLQSPLNFPYPSIKYIQEICSQATVKINSYQKCYLLKKTNKVLERRAMCTPSKHLKNHKASHTRDCSELFPECPVILITISWALEITVKFFELPLNWNWSPFCTFGSAGLRRKRWGTVTIVSYCSGLPECSPPHLCPRNRERLWSQHKILTWRGNIRSKLK